VSNKEIPVAINSDFDHIVTLEPRGDVEQLVPPEASAALVAVAVPTAPPELVAPAPFEPARKRQRPRWVVPAAIAVVGLIASGTLGYLFYDTNNKLGATRQHLSATQATLASTTQQLSDSQADAADQKSLKAYEAFVLADAGKVDADYNQVQLCDNYSSCRTWAQQALSDIQSFQSDRRTETAPSQFSSVDSQIGDSLSAGIAALNELISGMDNDNVNRIRDGFKKLEGAMLTMAKAEASIGSQVK
jgi:hypothetical protein